jgi:hypothetical protein
MAGGDQLRGVGQWDNQRHAGCIAKRAGHVLNVSLKTCMKGGGNCKSLTCTCDKVRETVGMDHVAAANVANAQKRFLEILKTSNINTEC